MRCIHTSMCVVNSTPLVHDVGNSHIVYLSGYCQYSLCSSIVHPALSDASSKILLLMAHSLMLWMAFVLMLWTLKKLPMFFCPTVPWHLYGLTLSVSQLRHLLHVFTALSSSMFLWQVLQLMDRDSLAKSMAYPHLTEYLLPPSMKRLNFLLSGWSCDAISSK